MFRPAATPPPAGASLRPANAGAPHHSSTPTGALPRACHLRNGQHGLCFVRAREVHRLVLRTYGRSSGFCIDPIEKKPLNHFLCGGHLAPVLDTLLYLIHETDVRVEITTLLIPGFNDSDTEPKAITRRIRKDLGAGVPLHVTAFRPDFRMHDVPPTPAATLAQARNVGLDGGLRYVYTGNVQDRRGNSTWCPGCGALVLERDWYEIGTCSLDHGGACRRGTAIAGVFDGRPGNWGGRRSSSPTPATNSRDHGRGRTRPRPV